jgi:hypothetical protein
MASASLGVANGVHVRAVPGGVVVYFGKHATALFRKVRGRDMSLDCTGFAPDGSRAPVESFISARRAVPQRVRLIRVKLLQFPGDGGYDVCEVGPLEGPPFARVPLTARGRTKLDEQHTAEEVVEVVRIAVDLSTDCRTWPAASELIGLGRQYHVVALPAADASPAAGAFGYFSDGAQHMAVSKLTAAGKRLFFELAGDVTTTNILDALPASETPATTCLWPITYSYGAPA